MDTTASKQHWTYRQIRDFAEDRRDWMRHVMADRDLEPTHRLIAVAIGLRTNHETEKSWPAIKKIAADTGTSTRTVIRAIKILAGEDATEKKLGKGKNYLSVKRKKRGGNEYSLNFPWIDK